MTLLKQLARKYKLTLDLNRQSSDAQLQAAFRRVVRWAHPDKRGSNEDMQGLNTARDAWEEARQSTNTQGRPPRAAASQPGAAMATAEPGHGIQNTAVMLTYQGFTGVEQWRRFLVFWNSNLRTWLVKYWCATLESNTSEGFHVHVMVQFTKVQRCTNRLFVFESLVPNAQTNDMCGEGWCKKRMQESIDRGMFYVWANKTSTVLDTEERQCVDGNYMPCWTSCKCRYEVKGRWPERLWKQRKVSTSVYDEYLHLSRDGVVSRKRNLDAGVEWEENREQQEEIDKRVLRFRNDPNLALRFPTVPAVQAWLKSFQEDARRYAICIAVGESLTGKTEWALSLFDNPLELKVGALVHFPEKMRQFNRKKHDGLVLDDVRDLEFLSNHQDKLQGKYSGSEEFASTTGGTRAYWRNLFAVPVVVTVNHSTRNLAYLESHDWLGKSGNRLVVRFPLPDPGASASATSHT